MLSIHFVFIDTNLSNADVIRTLDLSPHLAAMTQSTQPPVVYSFPDTPTLSESLAQYILKAQKESIDKHGKFTVAISGGSLPKTLTALIGKSSIRWNQWHVFYADERVVPLDDPDSNHKLAQDTLYSQVPIPPENIHTIDTELLGDLEELADAYEKELIREFAQKDSARFPVFDLILLGVGPDGHTASLFPDHELLSEGDRWVAYIEDSPKPPLRRITLTLPVINHACRVAFVATGTGKVKILSDILDHPELGLPAARVRPVNPGHVTWFVDDPASAEVKFAKSEFKL
jgi:6-phosphogluconolactonase